MPFRHVIALLLLIVTPLVLIGWLGATTIARQQRQQREQLQQVITDRLQDIDQGVQQVAAGYEVGLFDQLQSAARDIDKLSALRRQNPIVRSTLLVDRDGRLVYPTKPTGAATAPMAWHAALSELARNRPVGEANETVASASPSPLGSKRTPQPAIRGTRWQTWFHESGLQLVLWMPRSDRTATGVVLERGRWMADLINALPDSNVADSRSPDSQPGQGSYQLRDGADRIVYRWGDMSTDEDVSPFATVRLSSPWNAWHLAYSDPRYFTNAFWTAGSLSVIASLLAIAITLLLLGTYVLTSMKRQFTLAGQRVSFASHVSHELRTPLTNIRLYAELAKRDLDKPPSHDTAASAVTRLEVIEEESQRLSRIVSGVLDMVSGKGTLRASSQTPDDVICHALEGFGPSFASRSVTVTKQLHANEDIMLDDDVIELVLVNLLSNVEKYAGEGSHLSLTSRQEGSRVVIDVIDNGPGIPRSNAKRVFQPFERLDDSLSAPAGTGLGLSIARDAARRHGGDLVLVPSSSGAHFRFTFRAANDDLDPKVIS